MVVFSSKLPLATFNIARTSFRELDETQGYATWCNVKILCKAIRPVFSVA